MTVILLGLSTWIAVATTRRVTRYGASGMTAGMAAMMAAMGTGLSIGYTAGMVWDLGWATLIGVLAGGLHGLIMGRRFGPMAALDGAGGGVMGGLMGPMLAVMLLYLPLSLELVAILMLALQEAFSLGGVYLVAAAAQQVGPSGILQFIGRILGAHNQPVASCPEEVVVAPVPLRSRRSGSKKPAAQVLSARAQRQTKLLNTAAGLIAGSALVVIVVGLGGVFFERSSGSAPTFRSDGPASGAAGPPVTASPGPDGVQQVAMTLRYPRYEPRLVEVKAGTPVRLTVQAAGDPG